MMIDNRNQNQKTKIGTYDDKFYTISRDLNALKERAECKSLIAIFY